MSLFSCLPGKLVQHSWKLSFCNSNTPPVYTLQQNTLKVQDMCAPPTL